MNTNNNETPNYGEPWAIDRTDGLWNMVVSANGQCVTGLSATHRLIQCVNACAGMADPAAELAELKSERDEAREENEAMRKAIKKAHAALSWIVRRYDDFKPTYQIAIDAYKMKCTAAVALTKLQPFIK